MSRGLPSPSSTRCQRRSALAALRSSMRFKLTSSNLVVCSARSRYRLINTDYRLHVTASALLQSLSTQVIFAATTLRRIHNQVSCKNFGGTIVGSLSRYASRLPPLEPAQMANTSARNLCQRGHEVFNSLLKGRLMLDMRFPTLLNRDPI